LAITFVALGVWELAEKKDDIITAKIVIEMCFFI